MRSPGAYLDSPIRRSRVFALHTDAKYPSRNLRLPHARKHITIPRHLHVVYSQVILDLHDVPIPTELTPRRLSKVSHILVKSPFHASTLPRSVARAVANTMLRVEVIPNGVDTLAIATARTEVDGERAGVPVIDAGESVHTNGGTDPEAPVLIYTSSYDRGLEAMLRYGWPLILDRLPNASLHLYYGWQTHELRFPRSEWRESMRELIANSASVFDHGRVSQPELLKVRAAQRCRHTLVPLR